MEEAKDNHLTLTNPDDIQEVILHQMNEELEQIGECSKADGYIHIDHYKQIRDILAKYGNWLTLY
jgi:hypothetical protein